MGFTTERQENKTHITVQSSLTGRVKVHSISPPTLKESGTWDRINRSVRQSVISDDSCASWNTGGELSETLALSGHLNTRLTRFQRCFSVGPPSEMYRVIFRMISFRLVSLL